MASKEEIVSKCRLLLEAYRSGRLDECRMPEESNPGFSDSESEVRLAYFTLPMSLNYQRDSYKLWESALRTYRDSETRIVFDAKAAAEMDSGRLREYLMRYRLAMQPNKHVATWQRICQTVYRNWGGFGKLIEAADNDFLRLRRIVQEEHKKEFPYLSGPTIFNYWCFIVQDYGGAKLKNSEFIEIAPDTHIIKCSVRLGVITEEEAESLGRDEISKKWRDVLEGSGITPIEMHPPLWFWSRNGFVFRLD